MTFPQRRCQVLFHDCPTIYYALGRRPWSAAAGAPCSTPLRRVTTNVRGEAETTRTVRRARGKSRADYGACREVHRLPLHTTRRRPYVVFFIAASVAGAAQ